jgi:methylated-DNA-[protein]-cysteine S-methyltransferase
MDYVQHFASPLGGITLASDGQALTGLWFDGQAHFGATLTGAAQTRDLPVFAEAARWLALYFSGAQPDFTPPLRLIGTPFQRAVWEALRAIPYGQTRSYGALAAHFGSSARAVGGAVGRNPVALIVPCHRVVGADGSLTGYAGGLERKRWLLALEKSKASGF